MGKVIIVRCPLCGWARRYKANANLDDIFAEPPDGHTVLIQEVGGKVKTGRGIGRGKAKGMVRIERALQLEELDDALKKRIRRRAEKILERTSK